jgi:hypothetical protein
MLATTVSTGYYLNIAKSAALRPVGAPDWSGITKIAIRIGIVK